MYLARFLVETLNGSANNVSILTVGKVVHIYNPDSTLLSLAVCELHCAHAHVL